MSILRKLLWSYLVNNHHDSVIIWQMVLTAIEDSLISCTLNIVSVKLCLNAVNIRLKKIIKFTRCPAKPWGGDVSFWYYDVSDFFGHFTNIIEKHTVLRWTLHVLTSFCCTYVYYMYRNFWFCVTTAFECPKIV